MSALRSDAARSRSRILDAASAHATNDLRLNEIAKEAGVGVATVYRHFPTVRSLVEALTSDTVERMQAIAVEAAAEPDAGRAFASYLESALTLQLEDDGLQSILLARDDETPALHVAKTEIFATATKLLERAKDAGAVRSDLSFEQMEHLVCGIEHAVRLGRPGDRALLMQILLAGIRPS
jgi:AcrR family transcriptional regulator